MQKWEYITVTGWTDKDGNWGIGWIGDRQVNKLPLTKVLNQLGDEGWELVTSSYIATNGSDTWGNVKNLDMTVRLILKRPKS